MPAEKQTTENATPHQSPQSAAMELSIAVGTAAVEAWAKMGTETVRFAWERIEQDIKTQEAMLACTSLEEMHQVRADFMAAAREDYAAQTVKMLGLMGKAGLSGLKASKAARRYDDVPL